MDRDWHPVGRTRDVAKIIVILVWRCFQRVSMMIGLHLQLFFVFLLFHQLAVPGESAKWAKCGKDRQSFLLKVHYARDCDCPNRKWSIENGNFTLNFKGCKLVPKGFPRISEDLGKFDVLYTIEGKSPQSKRIVNACEQLKNREGSGRNGKMELFALTTVGAFPIAKCPVKKGLLRRSPKNFNMDFESQKTALAMAVGNHSVTAKIFDDKGVLIGCSEAKGEIKRSGSSSG